MRGPFSDAPGPVRMPSQISLAKFSSSARSGVPAAAELLNATHRFSTTTYMMCCPHTTPHSHNHIIRPRLSDRISTHLRSAPTLSSRHMLSLFLFHIPSPFSPSFLSSPSSPSLSLSTSSCYYALLLPPPSSLLPPHSFLLLPPWVFAPGPWLLVPCSWLLVPGSWL